jgi:hypothetical protein
VPFRVWRRAVPPPRRGTPAWRVRGVPPRWMVERGQVAVEPWRSSSGTGSGACSAGTASAGRQPVTRSPEPPLISGMQSARREDGRCGRRDIGHKCPAGHTHGGGHPSRHGTDARPTPRRPWPDGSSSWPAPANRRSSPQQSATDRCRWKLNTGIQMPLTTRDASSPRRQSESYAIPAEYSPLQLAVRLGGASTHNLQFCAAAIERNSLIAAIENFPSAGDAAVWRPLAVIVHGVEGWHRSACAPGFRVEFTGVVPRPAVDTGRVPRGSSRLAWLPLYA